MKRRIILVLMVGLCAFWGQGCCNSLQESDGHLVSKSLSDEIETAVMNLGYTQHTAGELAGMVLSWRNVSNKSFIAALGSELVEARQNRQQDRISESRLVGIERDIAERLVSEIRRRFQSDDRFFDLADVVKLHKAQCLSFTQVFYVTGIAIGLTIRPINVLELDKKGPLPAGVGHTACLVDLEDGSTITVNVVPNGFMSRSFVLTDTYEKTGNYLELKNRTNPLGVYRKIQILNREGLAANVSSNRASEHNTAGRYEEALAESSRSIQLCPMLAEAWNNQGIAHRNMGQIEEAISDYTRALELNPNYQEALNNRGSAYALSKQTDRSIADYSRAITLNPSFAEAYNNRGNTYASLGQFTQAIADYSQAIKYNSKLSQAYGNRAMNYAVLGRQREAQKDLVTAARLNPALKDYVKKVSDHYNLGVGAEGTAVLAAR
jgi:tetratricopeptide (TPR) repeat protein